MVSFLQLHVMVITLLVGASVYALSFSLTVHGLFISGSGLAGFFRPPLAAACMLLCMFDYLRRGYVRVCECLSMMLAVFSSRIFCIFGLSPPEKKRVSSLLFYKLCWKSMWSVQAQDFRLTLSSRCCFLLRWCD